MVSESCVTTEDWTGSSRMLKDVEMGVVFREEVVGVREVPVCVGSEGDSVSPVLEEGLGI